MHIGVDGRITTYARGGIANYVRALLPALAALDAETRFTVLHGRKGGSPAPPAANFRARACWTPAHHRLERWTLGAEVAPLRLDVLHSPDFIPPAWGARRTVITVHDLNFLVDPQFVSAESRRYYNHQIAWAAARADAILADSHATRADLIARLGTPADKVTVAHLAPTAAFRPLPAGEAAAVAARHGLAPGYLLFVGTLEPRKNVPRLLAAYRALLDGGASAAPLVLVGGKGWRHEALVAEVERLRLRERVRFLHAVPDADLPGLYGAAGVFVLPSLYEGFGLPVLEAMACGAPVVASDRSSLPEVVGEAGLLVDPEDAAALTAALARLLSDEPLRARLRAAGLQQAARFTWEQTARTTLAVYRRVLGLGA